MTPPAINRPPETAAKHLDMDTSVSEMRGVQERMLKQHTPLSNSQLVTKDSPLPPASRPQPAHPPIFLPPTNDPTSKPKTSDPTMSEFMSEESMAKMRAKNWAAWTALEPAHQQLLGAAADALREYRAKHEHCPPTTGSTPPQENIVGSQPSATGSGNARRASFTCLRQIPSERDRPRAHRRTVSKACMNTVPRMGTASTAVGDTTSHDQLTALLETRRYDYSKLRRG